MNAILAADEARAEPPAPAGGTEGSAIAEAYLRGLGVEAIARRTGVPVREVYWLLGRQNVAIRPARVAKGPKPETIELLRRIRQMRAEGCTYKQIGRSCGIAPGTVGVMLSTFREVDL
jgi:DNA-directed RNA polymerase specialized sigma24 family protein